MNPFGLFAQMPIQFASPLGAASWAVLAGVPVGIIALYFLKLRRRPVQVPSTLLWRRSMEDLHVNSLFQRLRRNLLLFLQLLAVLLAMLALAGPRMKGMIGSGQRYVIAIDESASMTATDISPTRFAKAKDEAKKVISEMQSNDLAMIIGFSDRARVVSNYTGNRHLLAQRVDAMRPTEGTTSLRDALQVAAGLANPNKVDDVREGVEATSVVTPKLSDLHRRRLPGRGGVQPGQPRTRGRRHRQGLRRPLEAARGGRSRPPEAASDNVAILALQASKNEEKPDTFQVFGRVHNYRGEAGRDRGQAPRPRPGQAQGPRACSDRRRRG